MKPFSVVIEAALLVGAVTFAFADPVDGRYVGAVSTTWSNASQTWWQKIRPSDGGILYLDAGGSSSTKLQVDVDVSLGGIVIRNTGADYFISSGGKTFSFVGDSPTLTVEGLSRAALNYVQGNGTLVLYDMGMKGTGDNTFVMKGTNLATPNLTLDNSSFSNFEGLSLLDGYLKTVVANGGTAVSTDPITLGEFGLEIVATSTEATTVSSGELTVGGASARLALDKGSAASLTVSTGGITVDTEDHPEATFVILPKAGTAELGLSERLMIPVKPVNGWISPATVAMDAAASGSYPVRFLKYDLNKGYVVNGDISTIAAATTISEEKTYPKGLVVDNASTLTFSGGAHLMIGAEGDGYDALGLAFNYGSAASDASFTAATGSGAIDFQGHDAYIWFAGPSASVPSRNVIISVPIVNARDVHLVGRYWGTEHGQYSQPLVSLAASGNDWSGDLYVSGVRLVLSSVTQFPTTSKIRVFGNQKAGGGQLYTTLALGNFSNNLVIAGYGLHSSSDAPGAFDYGSTGNSNLSAPITLAGDATINSQQGNLYLNNTIDGTGALTLTSAGDNSSTAKQIHLTAANTYDGATYLENVTTYLDSKGSFGTGPVAFSATGLTLYHNSTKPIDSIDSDLTGGGDFKFVGTTTSNMTFAGTTELRHLILNQTDVPAVWIKDLTVDTLPSRNDNAIHAVDGESVLRIGRSTGDTDLRASLLDDAGRLTLVKKGANTLTLVGPQKHTGGTIVSNGTLKLVAQADFPLRELCSLHLDASDPSTITTNSSGQVTEWRTVEGSAYYDANVPKMVSAGKTVDSYAKEGYKTFGYPKYVTSAAFGGKRIVRFETNTLDRLVASRETKNRTVFIVANILQTRKYSGFFGRSAQDYGVRLAANDVPTSFTDLTGESQSWSFVTGSNLYRDGVKSTAATRGTAYVYTLERYPYTSTSAAPDTNDRHTFNVALGGYMNANDSRWTLLMDSIRPIGYEIAEVIILKENVGATDRQRVEDYLSEKWLGKTISGTTFTPQAGVLGAETTVTIAEGGTLDLNGCDQTLASLAGVGTLCNSSTTSATLTVTGACDFKGEVKGNVKLSLASGSPTLHVSEGAALVSAATGETGGATVTAYAGYPHELPTDGILYWLDASLPETVLRDGDGFVTNWITRAPGSVSFASANNPVDSKYGVKLPAPLYYTGSQGWGDNQKPGVYFGASTTDPKVATLRSEKTCAAPKTVFLVHAKDGAANYSVCPGIWSPNAPDDSGIRWMSAAQSAMNFCGYAFYFFYGDSVRINGIEKVATESGIPASSGVSPFYLSGRALGAWHAEGGAIHALGCYYDNRGASQDPRGMKGWISEVIAYNRLLSDEEVAYVEEYLREKWFTAAGLSEEHTSIFGEDALKTLTVKVADDKTITPISLVGDFDATGWTLVVDDYKTLGVRNPKPAVPIVKVIDGTASGTFATNVTKPWYISTEADTGWLIGYEVFGLIIMVR